MSTRQLPPEIRARLLAIPLATSDTPSRRLPHDVRVRLLAIPLQRPQAPGMPRWIRRWLLDGRMAIAASSLLAVLAAPLVEAATEPSRRASLSLSSQVDALEAATTEVVSQSGHSLHTIVQRLHHETADLLETTHRDLVATGSLLDATVRSTLDSWGKPTTASTPQGE